MVTQLGLFEALPEQDREALMNCATRIKFPRSSYLFHEAQRGQSMFVVTSGRVGVWTGGERGRPTLVNTVGPSEVLGEMAILGSEHVRTASAQALTDVRAIQFDDRDIYVVLERHPRTYQFFINVLVGHVQRLTTQLGEFAELDGPTRVYRQLCALADTGHRVGQSTALPVAQHHLASLAGVSLRLASDVLTSARRAGLIRTGRGEIVVLDWPGVRLRAGLGRRDSVG